MPKKLSTLRRYNMQTVKQSNGFNVAMKQTSDGEYVKYQDYKMLMSKLNELKCSEIVMGLGEIWSGDADEDCLNNLKGRCVRVYNEQ